MKKVAGVSALVLAALAVLPSVASAQQVLSGVQSEQDPGNLTETHIGTTAGQTLTATLGGADTRAMTDYGVNRVAATGTAAYKQTAVSTWLDSFTVAGAAGSTVHLTFSFAVDGSVAYPAVSGAEMNYNVYALRGGGWTLSGRDYENGGGFTAPIGGGTGYESIIATRTTAQGIAQADLRDFDGFHNFSNNGGQPGNFGSLINYEAVGDYYTIQTPGVNGTPGMITRYYANGFRRYQPNGITPVDPTIIPYNTNAATMTQGVTRTNLVANYALLGVAKLCSDTCAPGLYPGSNLTLSFDLAAGSVFSIASLLYIDDLYAGTIDFFHTARVTGVTATGGGGSAGLTSASGALQPLAGGGFGYPAAATAAVPEPASWALMIAGFGLAGYAMRRRRGMLAAA